MVKICFIQENDEVPVIEMEGDLASLLTVLTTFAKIISDDLDI